MLWVNWQISWLIAWYLYDILTYDTEGAIRLIIIISSFILYCSKKRGTVNTISAIIFLTTLCSDKLSTKYSCMLIFKILKDCFVFLQQILYLVIIDMIVFFVLVVFQCLSEHDLVGPQDISHMKTSIFTMLSRINEDKAYRNGFEVISYYSSLLSWRLMICMSFQSS